MTIFNVRDYGALGDDQHDDTAAFTAAIIAAQAVRGTVTIPSSISRYLVTSLPQVTSSIAFCGEHYGGSIIHLTGTQGLSTFTADPLFINDLSIDANPRATTIYLDAPAGSTNTDSVIKDVHIVNTGYGLAMGSASRFNVDHLVVDGAASASVWVRNINFPDGGDATIQNSIFSGQPTAHLYYASAGDLRFLNNKCNGGSSSIQMALNTGSLAGTGTFQIKGCSLEGATYGILLQSPQRQIFDGVYIEGNEIACSSAGIWVQVNGNWLESLLITDNIFILGASMVGCEIGGTTGGLIDGNIFQGNSQSRGWNIEAGSDCQIGTNKLYGGTL